MVRVVVGRSGSGKSLRVYRRIVEECRAQRLGPTLFWIVPKQATFSAQRWLTCGGDLAGVGRCRVMSFDALADEVLKEVGGGGGAGGSGVITRAGRLMVLGHLLKRHETELEYFSPSSRQPGLAAELMALLDELGRNGTLRPEREGEESGLDRAIHAVEETEEPAGRDGPGTGALLRKLRDVRKLYERYGEFMGPGRFDKDTRMQHVLRHVGSCRGLRGGRGGKGGTRFFIDGFLELQDFERRMIVSLCEMADREEECGVDEVEVSFCMPADSPLAEGREIHAMPSEMSVFRRVEMAHRQLRIELESRKVRVEVARLNEAPRYRSTQLAALESLMAGGTKPRQIEDQRAVVLIEAPDARSEADAVSREIRRLTSPSDTAGGGGGSYRLRDIVVLVREMDGPAGNYERALSSSFREHGIAFFLDRKLDASCHPLLRVIRSALAIAATGWTTANVVSIAKSGFAEATEAEQKHEVDWGGWGAACRLEHWAVTRGVRGEGWTAGLSVAEADGGSAVESLREYVVGAVRPFAESLRREGGVSVRDACSRMVAMLESLRVRQGLARWMKEAHDRGDFQVAREHEQVWTKVMEFLQELSDLLGSEQVTADGLQSIVLAGLEGLELGFTPPTVDQVLVGTAERTRPGDAKVVFVLGLSAGVFPKSGVEAGGVVSDLERRRLASMGVGLDPDGRQLQLDERLTGYVALTRASEKLYLTRPTADERGAPLASSEYWDAIRHKWPGITIQQSVSETEAGLSELSTPRLLALGLLRWSRDPSRHNDPAWRGVYQRFANWPIDGSAVDVCRHAVWSSLVPLAEKMKPTLTPETVRKLMPLGDDLRLRDEQIESYTACPHQHFLKYILRLDTLGEPVVGNRELSGLLHELMGDVTREWQDGAVGGGGGGAGGRGGWPLIFGDNAAQTERRVERLTDAAIERYVRRMTWDGSADRTRLKPHDRYLLSRVAPVLKGVLRAHAAAAGRTAYKPLRARVKFGGNDHGELAGVRVPLTVAGKPVGTATITGMIDRIDVTPVGQRLAAWDYTWTPKGLDPTRLYHGLDVKMLLHLLVLRDHAHELVEGGSVSGAFVVGLRGSVESFRSLTDWADAPRADSEEALLARRRAPGVFNVDHLSDLDTKLESGRSEILSVSVNKDGSLRKGTKGAMGPAELNEFLQHAHETIARVASEIIEGRIDIMPYRLGKKTPCPDCEFRAVCRFDARDGGRYFMLGKVELSEKLSSRSAPPAEPATAAPLPPKQQARKGGRRG